MHMPARKIMFPIWHVALQQLTIVVTQKTQNKRTYKV